MAGSAVRIAILANGAQARREIATTATSLGGLSRLAKGGLAVAGVSGIALGLGSIVKSAVDLEAKFSTSMRLIGATTGATAGELKQLNDLAIQLGADTSFSASEAADAMLELAKAGIDTSTIMGGGLAGTLQLAAAGGTDLGTAATIASNALNTFGLGGEDMAAVAAALAGAANSSSASVESLGQALQQVGPGATNAGLTLQETVAALAAFDSAGIKGSDAGTSLKTMLARLVPTTDKARKAMESLGLDFVKGNGEFESLTNISKQLDQALSPLPAAQRSVALQTIFGSDATRAATVLTKEGAKGIRGFIKAANDQGAATKVAAARMGGTAGALERLSGASETARLRLGQELAPIVEKVADGFAENMVPAMEAVIDGAKELGDAVAPAVAAIAEALGDLIPSAETAGSAFSDQLVPAVSTLADVVAGVVGFINDLPGPLKEIAVQGALAALVLPRLAANATAAGSSLRNASVHARVLVAELRDVDTRGRGVATIMGKVGPAAAGAAGVGGMLALANGSKIADDQISILVTTLGGAATGFALGGPIGAAVGALGGLVTGIIGAKDETVKATESTQDYAGALDQTTGAINAQTRALTFQALSESGAFTAASQLGVSQTTLLNAALGRKGASEEVAAALAAEKTAIEGVTAAADAAADRGPSRRGLQGAKGEDQRAAAAALRDEAAARTANVATIDAEIGATVEQSKALANKVAVVNNLPEKVTTSFQTDGLPKNLADVRQLAKQYQLTPKQIRTVVQLSQLDSSKKQVNGLIDRLLSANKIKLDLPQVKTGVQQSVRVAERAAGQGGGNIVKELKQATRKAKADLSAVAPSVTNGLGPAKDAATTGGNQVGSNLKAGVIAGFSGTLATLSAQAAAAVRGAIAAARNAGKIKSPSRETRYIGEMLGEGLVVGMGLKSGAARAGARALVDAAMSGLRDLGTAAPVIGAAGENVNTAVGNVTDLVEKTFGDRLTATTKRLERKGSSQAKKIKKKFDGKKEDRKLDRAERAGAKATRRAERASQASINATNASVAAQVAQLRDVAARHDANSAALQTARDDYRALTEAAAAYAATVRDAVVSSGSIIGLGEGVGFGSVDQLIQGLRARVATAETYSQTIQALTAAGLNQTNLQQLIDAGVEGGIGTAQAILNGGPAAISSINTLTAQLNTTATTLGTSTAATFYQSGIDAAAGLVAGLESKQAEIEALAAAIGAAVAAGLAAGLADSVAPAKAGNKAADKTTKATKKKFKTRSPSKVFRGIGQNVAQGLAIGIGDVNTTRAGIRLADTLTSGFGQPALEAYTAGGPAGGVIQQVNVTVEVPPTADQAAIGKAIQASLNAYAGLGGRRAA